MGARKRFEFVTVTPRLLRFVCALFPWCFPARCRRSFVGECMSILFHFLDAAEGRNLRGKMNKDIVLCTCLGNCFRFWACLAMHWELSKTQVKFLQKVQPGSTVMAGMHRLSDPSVVGRSLKNRWRRRRTSRCDSTSSARPCAERQCCSCRGRVWQREDSKHDVKSL